MNFPDSLRTLGQNSECHLHEGAKPPAVLLAVLRVRPARVCLGMLRSDLQLLGLRRLVQRGLLLIVLVRLVVVKHD